VIVGEALFYFILFIILRRYFY